MSDETITTTEARGVLSTTLARFRRDGAFARPVIFGDHRKREAVVLPFELYEMMEHEMAQARLLANTELMDNIDAYHADPSLAVKLVRPPRNQRKY